MLWPRFGPLLAVQFFLLWLPEVNGGESRDIFCHTQTAGTSPIGLHLSLHLLSLPTDIPKELVSK